MRPRAVRPLLVRLHRYAGLGMAGFLLVAGLTGILLAWNAELERSGAIPGNGAVPLDPLA
nr:PepSY domain-containing protein [uncultured Duganella sp.]